MNPRSHSLNHVVCVTMTAIDAAPTTSVHRNATTCSERRAMDMVVKLPVLESLPDAEVHAPVTLLRFAVHLQVLDGCELVAEVDARRADWGEVPQARSGGVAQVAEVEVPRIEPDVA